MNSENNMLAARRHRVWPIWLSAFAFALAVYVGTANRGPQWQDSGWQQVRIVSGDINHPLGLALTHPLQFYLGRLSLLLPFSEPAFGITLVSSLAGAIAIANIVVLVLLLKMDRFAAFAAGGALLVAHTFWQEATHTESYTLVVALLTAEWLCLVGFFNTQKPGWILLVALFSGLGIGNHLLAGLAVPVNVGVGIWALRRHWLRWPHLLAYVGIWLIASLPYTALVAKTMLDSGDFWGTARSALVGNFARDVFNTRIESTMILSVCGYILLNFPNLMLPCAIAGLGTRRSNCVWFVRVLKIELLIFLIFAARYTIVDQYTFFAPVYAILAIFGGLGCVLMRERLTKRRLARTIVILSLAVTPAVYVANAYVLEKYGWFKSMAGDRPYRNGYRALFVPWGVGLDHPTQTLNAAIDVADGNGVILVLNTMARFPFRYAQLLERVSDDIDIEFLGGSQRIMAAVDQPIKDGKNIVLVPRDRNDPEIYIPGFWWERHGDVYLLKPMQTR